MNEFYLISDQKFTKFKFPIHLFYKFGWCSNIVTGAWATYGCGNRYIGKHNLSRKMISLFHTVCATELVHLCATVLFVIIHFLWL